MPALPTLLRIMFAFVGLSAASGIARAEKIRGTFEYEDPTLGPLPLRGAYVEIWQKTPWAWQWSSSISTHTDAAGTIDVDVPFAVPGTQTSLRIHALNRAVDVREKDVYSRTFYQQPGPPGATVALTAWSATDVLDFSFSFTDPGAVGYYNMADVMLRGLEYAEARRDSRETDTIGAVVVHLSSSINSFYDSVFRVIHIDDDLVGMDDELLHEYAHFLENEISSFQAWAAFHDGCTEAYDPPRYAWMEGFASYFAEAVIRTTPGVSGGLVPELPLCTKGGELVNLEIFVAAALLDLIDSASASEPADRICNAQHDGVPNDVRIFQIFDHELEIGPNNPRLVDFTTAWIGRGYDVPFAAFGPIGAGLTSPPPTVRYDHDTVAANKAIWRPWSYEWWILGSAHPTVDRWGWPGDVPVPADYDGDGYTDIAIWRPSDGMWWVIHSSSNIAPPPVQWGMNGDIPVPGDYDGDGEDDYAVYRPSSETLHIYGDTCAETTVYWWQVGAGTPVVGDFDNNGRDDLALYRPDGSFTIHLAAGNAVHGSLGWTPVWGGDGFFAFLLLSTPVVGDFDGDQTADLGRFDLGTAVWRIRMSSTGAVSTFQFGNPFDQPVPADYDGDGITDLATWTANDGTGLSYFHVMGEPDQQWGIPGDIPVPAP